jgi:hypothetical protein
MKIELLGEYYHFVPSKGMTEKHKKKLHVLLEDFCRRENSKHKQSDKGKDS